MIDWVLLGKIVAPCAFLILVAWFATKSWSQYAQELRNQQLQCSDQLDIERRLARLYVNEAMVKFQKLHYAMLRDSSRRRTQTRTSRTPVLRKIRRANWGEW